MSNGLQKFLSAEVKEFRIELEDSSNGEWIRYLVEFTRTGTERMRFKRVHIDVEMTYNGKRSFIDSVSMSRAEAGALWSFVKRHIHND